MRLVFRSSRSAKSVKRFSGEAMLPDLKPYPQMKDSGVEWLGDVPSHWGVWRLKHWLSANRRTLSEDTNPDYTFDYVDIGSVGTGYLVEPPIRLRFRNAPSRARRVVRPGDTLMSTVRTYLKAVWQVNEAESDLIASTGFVVLTPNSFTCPKFVGYVCQNENFTNQVTANSVGIAYPAISETKLGTFEVAVPTLPEQTAITRFLDHATDRIDRSIRAREKLIALLEEQKHVLVHDAVTGRIDVRTGKPYPSYKPSGAKWLGEVPAHWGVERLKSLMANVVDQSHSGYGEGIFLALEHVESWTGKLQHSERAFTPEGQSKGFQAGDILFGKLRPYLAKVTRLEAAGSCVSEFLVLRSRHRKYQGGYAEYFLRSKLVIDTINGSTYGARMPRAEWTFIGSLHVPCPPAPEQTAIARFLDDAMANADQAIDRKRREIELLCEYRTRLIADVVTGKLDVREADAELPEPGSVADDFAGETRQAGSRP